MKGKVKMFIIALLLVFSLSGITSVVALESRYVVLPIKKKTNYKEIENVIKWNHFATFYPSVDGRSCTVKFNDIRVTALYTFQPVFKSMSVDANGFKARARINVTKDYKAYWQYSTLEY